MLNNPPTGESDPSAFEQKTGSRLVMVPGHFKEVTHDAILSRLARGEPDAVLIMVGGALDKLVKQGEVVPVTEVDIGLSLIGTAVGVGSPVPDFSRVVKLFQVLLVAKSVAYSDSASALHPWLPV